MSDKTIIRHLKDVKKVKVKEARGTEIQVALGPDDKMPNYYTRCFTIQPGGSIPRHRHDKIEHQQVILEGEVVATLDDGPVTFKAGDVIYIPAQASHGFENKSQVPVRLICIVPATSDFSTEWF